MGTMDLVLLSDVEGQLDPFMQYCYGPLVRYMESRSLYMELDGDYIIIYVYWLLQRSCSLVSVASQYGCVTVVRIRLFRLLFPFSLILSNIFCCKKIFSDTAPVQSSLLYTDSKSQYPTRHFLQDNGKLPKIPGSLRDPDAGQ